MRRDTFFLDQPGEHRCRTIGGIGSKVPGLHTKALLGALDHGPGSPHFRLTDGTGCLHIDNDGMLVVDQIVGGIGKERRPFVGAGPLRGRIRW